MLCVFGASSFVPAGGVSAFKVEPIKAAVAATVQSCVRNNLRSISYKPFIAKFNLYWSLQYTSAVTFESGIYLRLTGPNMLGYVKEAVIVEGLRFAQPVAIFSEPSIDD